MAEIDRVRRAYLVQTPCKAFPVQPHYLTPFIHWLSKGVRRRVARRFTLWAWITRPTQGYVDQMVDEIRLLTRTELSALFPEAGIVTERFWCWPKSLIALRRGDWRGRRRPVLFAYGTVTYKHTPSEHVHGCLCSPNGIRRPPLRTITGGIRSRTVGARVAAGCVRRSQ